jgi:hypothetical protein
MKDIYIQAQADYLDKISRAAPVDAFAKVPTEFDPFYQMYSKFFINEIEKRLAKHYGFSDEELDFIINYDIKYRMRSHESAWMNKFVASSHRKNRHCRVNGGRIYPAVRATGGELEGEE